MAGLHSVVGGIVRSVRTARQRIPFAAVASLALLGALFVPAAAAAQAGIPINIESVPPGATVYVDSPDGAPLGVTPLTAARVPAGSHVLIFRMPNFEEARLSVTVRRRRETFRAVLRPLGTIEVSAGNDGARGAQVRIDGQPVGGGTLGSLPIRVENLQPGRHQVQANREGYLEFQQWIDVLGGQVVRVTAMLERAAPTTGSVLVTADVQGAPIFLDGEQVGTTTAVLDDVPAGMHQLEIRASGEDQQPFSQQIVVQPGRRATVTATLRRASTAPTTGTIAVITDAPGAQVRINGQPLPVGQLSRDNLAPGEYVVQVLAEGYQPFRRQVTVVAGQVASIDVAMTAELGPPGRINITATNVSGAMITVDGEQRAAPYVVNEPGPGTHAVVVTAPGYEDVSFTCSTAPGTQANDSCERSVEMRALAVAIRVAVENETEVPPVLLIDGVEVGRVPYEGRIPVGDHRIEIQADGYMPFEQQMIIEYTGGPVQISTRLRDLSEEAAAEGVTHSALPITINHPMIDMSIGYPYLAELRLGVGVHQLVDAGFAIRTFGRITEFEGRVRVGGRLLRQIAVGGQARFGGGIGPSINLGAPVYAMGGSDFTNRQNLHPEPASEPGASRYDRPVNTAFFSVDAMLSLLLEPVAAVTLWLGMDVTSDEYYAHARQSGAWADFGPGGTMDVICAEAVEGTERVLNCPAGRQTMGHLRFGGSAEFVLTREWNMWVVFEGVVWEEPDHRRMLGGFIADSFDIRIYPRLGATYKF